MWWFSLHFSLSLLGGAVFTIHILGGAVPSLLFLLGGGAFSSPRPCGCGAAWLLDSLVVLPSFPSCAVLLPKKTPAEMGMGEKHHQQHHPQEEGPLNFCERIVLGQSA